MPDGRTMILADLLELIENHRLAMDTAIYVMRDRDAPDPHTGATVYEDPCTGAEITVGDGYSAITFLIASG